MIFDQMKNAEIYENYHEGFALGFAFIRRAVAENLPTGKYELDGEKVYASVQEYTTKDSNVFEAHRRYIDIQCIVSGEEAMESAQLSNCTEIQTYSQENDAGFYDGDGQAKLIFKSQDFAVFFPQDAHKPGLKVSEKSTVKKIVVKVLV